MASPKVRAFIFGCYATVLCLVAPSRFLAQAKVYDSKLPPQSKPEDQNAHLAKIVRRAFWGSFSLTVGFSALGYSLGLLLQCLDGPATPATAKAVQLASAGLVLVATLATGGWKIQTFSGNTLPEKVNQWITRGLYVIGTFLFTVFLGWAK
jgi:hypothetical protein